jgi:hypothetical protein
VVGELRRSDRVWSHGLPVDPVPKLFPGLHRSRTVLATEAE